MFLDSTVHFGIDNLIVEQPDVAGATKKTPSISAPPSKTSSDYTASLSG